MTELLVRKGLVIDQPWISMILAGQKDWEMRSSSTSHRGWFGLIWKGMGSIYGVARLVDVGSKLDPDAMVAAFEHHQIPEELIRSGVSPNGTHHGNLLKSYACPSRFATGTRVARSPGSISMIRSPRQ